jgi:hypothetical protein
MTYHKDLEVNEAIKHLLDALCGWERGTGRKSTLIFIPYEPDENLVLAMDGKPIREDDLSIDLINFTKIAILEREKARLKRGKAR